MGQLGGGAGNVMGLAVDGAGNLDALGAFQGAADLDPGAGTFNLTSAGSEDAPKGTSTSSIGAPDRKAK